ncbi:MAG: hypothetical protein NVS1B6_18330 [Steroidobacteraceae bacterium]
MKRSDMRLVAAELSLLALAGCAPTVAWNKPGGTQADFDRDNYSCERDARQSGYYGQGLAGEMNMRNFFKRCMVAQGYSLERGSPSLTSTAPVDPTTDEECLQQFGVKCPAYIRKQR